MLKFFAALILITMMGCGHATEPNASPRTCSQVRDVPEGNVLLFGEVHGSVEAPRLISDLACSLSESKEVAVGLEISSKDQPLIDVYLKSIGAKRDIEKLTSSNFWQKGKDGRSSAAILNLIDDVRVLRGQGHSIRLFAFDNQPGTDLERNVAIANGIRHFHAKHPNVQVIALMGRVHAMQTRMTTSDGPVVPSGSLLSDLKPVSILITYPRGTTWACMPTCGIHEISPSNHATGPSAFRQVASFGGYSHSFQLSSITASPPAVQETR